MLIRNTFPIYLRLRKTAQIPTLPSKKRYKSFWSFIKKGQFGIISLRENGILKTDSKENANICNQQFQAAFTHEADSDLPSKWDNSPFSSMGKLTVDLKGVAKQLDGLNVHKASGPDGLNARVLKECSNDISPMLTLIFNESLAWCHVTVDCQQANVLSVF